MRYSIRTISLLILCLTIKTAFAFTIPGKNLWPIWEPNNATSQKTINHSTWQKFLKKYVHTNIDGINVISYGKVSQADKDNLDDYIWRLSQIKIAQYNRNTQLAYWINLYNALVVKVILEHYPVDTIRQINISPGFFAQGPWKANLVKVDGIALSLDDIEHRILRPIWNDPRIFYGINCGSVGCPNLQKTAFTGANVNQLLNKAAKEYINSLRGVQIIDKKLVTSRLYQWYKKDFGGSDQDVINHLMIYANPKLKKQLQKFHQISDSEYNWHLNDSDGK